MATTVKFVSHREQRFKEISSTLESNMQSVVQFLKRDIVKSLGGARHGIHYPGRVGISAYTASAPGEAPAHRTGNLASRIDTKVEKATNQVTGIVGTHVNYAIPLEFGSMYMQPRPFMFPAVGRNKKMIIDTLKQTPTITGVAQFMIGEETLTTEWEL